MLAIFEATFSSAIRVSRQCSNFSGRSWLYLIIGAIGRKTIGYTVVLN